MAKSAKGTLEQLDRRAQWVIDRWDERPSLRYTEMLKEVRAAFECGKTAAEKAIQRAYEILRETWADPALSDRIAHKYMAIVEGAERAGEFRAARAALDSLRRHLGLGAPDRVEHSGGLDINAEKLEDLTEDELRIMAKVAPDDDAPAGGVH